MTAKQPPARLLELQAEWLAPIRARLLRRAGIGHRRRILDAGCGSGIVTAELARRSPGSVAAVDSLFSGLPAAKRSLPASCGVFCATIEALPFDDESFDLIFCQCALLWTRLERAARELKRVLSHDGLLVAIEPDYGGLIEHPEETAVRGVWLAAISRSGGDPFVGRKLPGVFHEVGLTVTVDLLAAAPPPSISRFEFLRTLPLTSAERAQVDSAMAAHVHREGPGLFAHLPFICITARAR